MFSLTPRQAELLAYRRAYPEASYRDMARGMGLSAKSHAFNTLRRAQHRLAASFGYRFIPAAHGDTSGKGPPRAATDPYPFLNHRTCAEWEGE